MVGGDVYHAATGELMMEDALNGAPVHALAGRPGVGAGRLDHMAFSLLSNEAGVLDGDVLGFSPTGGLIVLVAEEELAAGLGVPGASLDVDALAYDEAGALLFSLQADLDDSVLGPVADGDILRRDAAGAITRSWTEEAVQAACTAATGSASAIGDVQGLSYAAGQLSVLVQAPSASDGALIRIDPQPSVLFDEAQAELGGAELDAIATLDGSLGADLPRLTIDPQLASPGSSMTASYLGGGPSELVVVLAAGGAGWFDAPYLAGVGGFAMDPLDPWLVNASQNGVPLVVLDVLGQANSAFQLPVGVQGGTGLAGEMGWTFQTVELGALVVGEPYRVQL